MLTVINKHQFDCHYCSKRFNYQTLLRRHLSCHTGDKPYACIYCRHTFTQKSNLEKHIRTHTGERPFQCRHCHRRFTQKSNVDRHMRTHTGERPFSCQFCQRCFTQKSNVERHMKIHFESNVKKVLGTRVYSSKTVLNQDTNNVFGQITGSLDTECNNMISMKSCSNTFLHDYISQDIENIISPMIVLDDTQKHLPHRDQINKGNILCENNPPNNKPETDQFLSRSNIEDTSDEDLIQVLTENYGDLHRSPSPMKKILMPKIDIDKNDDNRFHVYMKPHSHHRLIWKRPNRRKHFTKVHRHKHWNNTSENNSVKSQTEFDISTKPYHKVITHTKIQVHKTYSQFVEKFNDSEKISQTNQDPEADVSVIEDGLTTELGTREDNQNNESRKNQVTRKYQGMIDNATKYKNTLKRTQVINVKHVTSLVQVSDDYKCPICQKTFAHKCNVGKHMLLHAGVKPYRCEQCGKAFSQKCNAQRHMKIHIHNNSSTEQNVQKSHINVPVQSVHEDQDLLEMCAKEEFPVPGECKKDFSSGYGTIGQSPYNKISTTGKLPFKCVYCFERYCSYDTLLFHMKSHSNDDTMPEKPFKCGYCFSTFTTLDNLGQHIRIHKNYKNGKQEYSQKSIKYQPSRDIFEPSDSDFTITSCEYCGHNFPNFFELSKHEEICHFENKAYTCKPCKSIVLGTKQFLVHLRKYHKQIEISDQSES